MKTRKIWALGVVILATFAAVAAGSQSAASGAPGGGDGLCLARLAAPMSTAGPVCGSCSGQCHSDGVCKGKVAGDACNGGTCQVVGGCGMFDCCRCTSAFAVLSPTRGEVDRDVLPAQARPQNQPTPAPANGSGCRTACGFTCSDRSNCSITCTNGHCASCDCVTGHGASCSCS